MISSIDVTGAVRPELRQTGKLPIGRLPSPGQPETDTVTLRFQGQGEAKKNKRGGKLLLATVLGAASLVGGHFANSAITKAPLAPVAQAQRLANEQTPEQAKQRFDNLVERFVNDNPSNAETYERYLRDLEQVNVNKLSKEYKGLHQLFENHLRYNLFLQREGQGLSQMGVDLTQPRTEAERMLFREKVYGRPSAQLMEGGIGKDRYDALMRYQHHVNLNSEQLIRYSEQVYRELEAEMTRIANEIDPGKPWQEVYQNLRKDHPKKNELLDTYRREVDKARKFLKDHGFISTPREDIRVIETPSWWRDSVPFAAYMYNGNGRGTFLVTTVVDEDPAKEEEQLRAHSYYFIPSVVVHEAFPGHHLQHVHDDNHHIDRSNPDNQTMLRVFDMIPSSSYYAEGWGVYSEILMKEKGYYDNDPKSKEKQLFALRNLLWRAARAYIDPQIHTGKMSYDQAVDFLVKNLVMERDRAEIEVNRYYQRPTEVPSYMIGNRQILQLRQQLENRDSAPLDLKRFHDELLKHGGIPVPPLARILFDEAVELTQPANTNRNTTNNR